MLQRADEFNTDFGWRSD